LDSSDVEAGQESTANSPEATLVKGEWSSFRGPGGMGVSSAAELPLTWSDTENIVWKTPLSGAGASSPIVQGGHIYLTSYTGWFVPGEPGGSLEELTRHLLCFSRKDGKL